VVQPDAGGQCEEFGGDPGAEAVEAAGVVAFEAEAAFEGPEDAFDALSDRRDVRAASGLVLAAGAHDRGAEALVGGVLELIAGVALVGDDQLAAVQAPSELGAITVSSPPLITEIPHGGRA